MQPQYLSIGDVFSLPRRYLVPLFQRPYVWNEEEQWEPLWADVRRLADRELVSPGQVNPHFLGSVVLEQLMTQAGHLDRREVIDGQQRLTTLQILAKASADAMKVAGATAIADIVARMTVNPTMPTDDPNARFKVWPTNADRPRFKRVMEIAGPSDLNGADEDDRLAQAYKYFYNVATGWLSEQPYSADQRATALANTLHRHVRLVVLDLDKTDEPQVIFETLNARGTPLLPADLVKNWLLRQAEREDLNATVLYETYWAPFDNNASYWRTETGRGHTARPRIDSFLQHYLGLRLREQVPVNHLYATFLRFGQSPMPDGLEGLLTSMHRYAGIFRRLDAADGSGRVDVFLRRFKAMDFVTAYPFLLYLFGRLQPDAPDAIETVVALESFLVRRMVCQLNTRGYGQLFIDLLAHVANEAQQKSIADAVSGFLSQSDSEGARWPDDDEFRDAWVSNRLYRQLTRPRVTLILRALEEQRRTPYTEAVPLPMGLEVEHVMPRKWQKHWTLPAGEDTDGKAAQRRKNVVETIGNLTLVTHKLNKRMSHAAWHNTDDPNRCKRNALKKHSVLRLNAELVENDTWDEGMIQKRAVDLFQTACELWPAPAPKATGPA